MTHNLLSHVKAVFSGIGEYFSIKLFPSYIIPALVYLIGLQNLFILKALLFLIIFDFITGLLSAYKTGQHITSPRAVRSAYKLAVYGLLLSASHLAGVVAFQTNFVMVAMSTFLALTELISIIENAGKMGYAIPQKLLNQLQALRADNGLNVDSPEK